MICHQVLVRESDTRHRSYLPILKRHAGLEAVFAQACPTVPVIQLSKLYQTRLLRTGEIESTAPVALSLRGTTAPMRQMRAMRETGVQSGFWCWDWGLSGMFLMDCGPLAAQSLRPVGPPGGDVQALTALPGGTRILYFGTPDGHIFGSADSGEQWTELGRWERGTTTW